MNYLPSSKLREAGSCHVLQRRNSVLCSLNSSRLLVNGVSGRDTNVICKKTFFPKTFDDCVSALLEARSRKSSWSDAIDDFVGIGSVPIMSIHKSKGLEFHTVVF